ncbi:unnamed protein product, partial [Rotaria magnacalcarata]
QQQKSTDNISNKRHAQIVILHVLPVYHVHGLINELLTPLFIASLPESIHRRWYEITGHHRLERYGMTECGIALSNPSKGERIPG